MKTLEVIKRTREYLDYLEEHIINVSIAWEIVKDKCKDMRVIWDDYYFQLLNIEVQYHDLSKMSEQEFVQYRKSFYPVFSYSLKYDISEAWDHHKKNNTHHWENWTTKKFYNPNIWEVHCTHMVIDWLAMSLKFGDSPREYYEKNKDKINLPQYAKDFVYEIFKRLEQ